MLAVAACARSPPCRYLSGSRSAGLTHRAKLLTTRLQLCSQARTHWCCATASNGGSLADILECNPLLRQQTSAIASAEFQESLYRAEVVATHPAAGRDIDIAPGTQRFKDTLRDVAIPMPAAHGELHIVFVRRRSNGTAPEGVSKVTIFSRASGAGSQGEDWDSRDRHPPRQGQQAGILFSSLKNPEGLPLGLGLFHCFVHFHSVCAETWMTAARLMNASLIDKLNYSPCQ